MRNAEAIMDNIISPTVNAAYMFKQMAGQYDEMYNENQIYTMVHYM